MRAFYEQGNNDGVLDRIEIHDTKFSGSPIKLTANEEGFVFRRSEITRDSNEGLVNPNQNRIAEGVLTFYPQVTDTDAQNIIDDIISSPQSRFELRWLRDGQLFWKGRFTNRRRSFSEAPKKFATLRATDFEHLKSFDYPLDDGRETLIKTIATALDSLDFGLKIRTATSWTTDETTDSIDFLSQVYHEREALRTFGQSVQEQPRQINMYDALFQIGFPALIFSQVNGEFRVDQLSAFDDPENVHETLYNSDGTIDVATTTVDRRQSVGTKAIDPVNVKVYSDNDQYPALKRSSVRFNHRSLLAATKNIGLVEFDSSGGNQSFRVNISTDGSQSASVRASIFSSFSSDPTNPRTFYQLILRNRVTGVGQIATSDQSPFEKTVLGSGTLFTEQLSPGDEIFTSAGVFVGVVDEIEDNNELTLVNDAQVVFTGSWQFNDGEDYWYDESEGGWVTSAVNNTIQLTLTNPDSPFIQRIAQGELSVSTEVMPSDINGNLTLLLSTAFDNTVNADVTEFRDTFLFVIDSDLNSSVDYQLTQDDAYSDSLPIGQTWFGDGPVKYAPSALRWSQKDDDVFEASLAFGQWRRRGDTTGLRMHHLLLKEYIDLQRNNVKKLVAQFNGGYDPSKITVYKGVNYYPSGYSYNGKWAATLYAVGINEEEDTFEEFVEPSNVPSAPGGGSGGGGGLSQSTADARYFRQSNNLSEGDPSTIRDNIDVFSKGESDDRFFRQDNNLSEGVPATMRDNLELKSAALREANQDLRTTDSVEFASVEADGIIVEDGIRQNTSDIITNFLRGDHLSVQKVDLFSDATLNTLSLTEQATEEDQAVRADRDIIAGDGLTGGGDLTGDVTLNVDVDDATIEIDGDLRVKDAGITEPKVADDAISTPKIQDDAITTGKILDGNVTNVKLANSTISGKELGTNLDSLSTGTGMTGDAYNGSASKEFSTVPATPSQAGHVSTGSQSFGGDKTFEDEVLFGDLHESDNFSLTTDFTGTGWSGSHAGDFNVRNLVVREAARFRELIIDQLSAVGGSFLYSAARGKVESRDGNVITLEDPNGKGVSQFAKNDIFVVRVVDIDGSEVKFITGRVSAVDGVDITLAQDISDTTGSISDISAGDVIVQRGNTSDTSRQNAIYVTATDSDAPSQKYFTGLDSIDAFNQESNIVVQSGNLANITNASGFGFYGENTFLTGSLLVGDLTESSNFLKFDGSDLTASLDSLSIEAVGDVGSSVLSLESDVIQLGLQSENSSSGIEFLSGRTIVSAQADGRLVTLDLDANPEDGSVFTVRSNFFDWVSDDIVVRGGFDDLGTAKIVLGEDAVNQDLTSDNGEGVYMDGDGNFRFGVLDDNGALEKGILFDGTDLEIATEKLLVDTGGGFSNADFFLDSEEHQLSLGDVFSVDGGTNEGQIAGWLARTDGFYDSANLGIVRNKNLDVFLGSFDGSPISDNFRGLYLDETNYFMRFESGDRVFQIGEENEFMFYRTGLGLRIQGDITANEGRFLGDIIVEGDGKITNESTYEIDEDGIKLMPSAISDANNAISWAGSSSTAHIQGLGTANPGIAAFTGSNGFFRYTRAGAIQFESGANGFDMRNIDVLWEDSTLVQNAGSTQGGRIQVEIDGQTRYIQLFQ